MNRGRAIAAVAGAGVLAGVNRLLAARATPLSPPLGPQTGTYRWRGMDIGYTEGGDPERPDVLLLHDVHPAGSSREFVRIFDDLAEEYHVIAPDFPGFGRSDRPPVHYSDQLYVSFVEDLVGDLTDEPACLASSLAGTYAVAAAEEADIGKLLLVCPRTSADGRGRRLFGRLHRLPLIGTAASNLRTTRFALRRSIGRERLLESAALDDEDLTYFWETAHQPGARYGIGSLVAGDLDSPADLGARLEAMSVPTTLLWGRGSESPAVADGRELAERADAKLVVVDRCRTWPHYEQAESFHSLLVDELPTVTG